MGKFGARSTTDEVLADIDLSGRIVMVTGGYSGLGRETARAMAAKGARVVLAGRDETKLSDAAREIEAETGAEVETIVCDLASLDSVRACGKEARERFERIDLLINNAAVMACPKGKTADGFEMQFGTNHLGHFALVAELMPLLEKGGDARVVILSSRAHHNSAVDLDDPHYEHREYEKWASYGQSKSANALFAVEFDRRYGDRGIRAYAVHPGGIATNLGRHLSNEDIAAMLARYGDMETSGDSIWKTVEQGASTTCWAATAPELAERGGVYCEDCGVAEVTEAGTDHGVRAYAVDSDAARRLWDLSVEATGARYPG